MASSSLTVRRNTERGLAETKNGRLLQVLAKFDVRMGLLGRN